MTANVGRKLVVKDDTDSVVMGLRTTSPVLSSAAIDVTDVNSNGYRELLVEAGEIAIDLSVDGVTKDNKLRSSIMQGVDISLADYKVVYPDGEEIKGDYKLTSLAETGAYNDAVQFTAELVLSGERDTFQPPVFNYFYDGATATPTALGSIVDFGNGSEPSAAITETESLLPQAGAYLFAFQQMNAGGTWAGLFNDPANIGGTDGISGTDTSLWFDDTNRINWVIGGFSNNVLTSFSSGDFLYFYVSFDDQRIIVADDNNTSFELSFSGRTLRVGDFYVGTRSTSGVDPSVEFTFGGLNPPPSIPSDYQLITANINNP